MRIRTVLTSVALVTLTAAPAHALTHTTMTTGPWTCAGVEPVAGVCVNNPWTLLP